MSLMDSLGLDNVSADPNALPDYNGWIGVVRESKYVVKNKDNSVNHVITYKVTEGKHKGAERQEWFNLGTVDAQDENGKVTAYTPTMTEDRKSWYKKRFVDLGIAEDQVSKTEPEALVGTPVRFGTKKKDGFININFVEVHRTADGTPAASVESGASAGAIQGLL